MRKNQYSDLLLDQTKDLIWAVDGNLCLVYANKAYFNLMKQVTGEEKALDTPILVEGFGKGYIEKWNAYYQRALSGEFFEVEEHFYNPEIKERQYGHIAFSPIRDEHGEILSVACRSTAFTPVMKQKDHASQLMDASLDVFCTIDEAGKFVFVNAVSADHWGYQPEELIGKPYRDLIVEEDLEKTDVVAGEIMAGKEFKSFSNRFRKKNGDIAYNLWSARWDDEHKLMYCVARDEKEKIEEQSEKELLSQISLSFNNEEELIPAANRLCENLYDFEKFDLIELWCPNMERTQIKLVGHSTHNQDFYDLEPSESSFQKGEGLQGKVWENRKQLLWDEKQINKHFVRKKGASLLGLQAILGVPMSFNDELVGVLLIGSRQKPDYLQENSPVLSRLENFVGSEINRKRLENSLRNVFDAIPEILCITDFEGRFLKINNAGCALLGYATDEVLFHSLNEFTLKEDRGKFEQEIKEITKGTSDFIFENRFLSKDGKVIWLSWNCNPAFEEGLVYASAKNITAEVQLRELNALAGSMAKIGSWEIDIEKNTVYWSKIVHQLHDTDADSFEPDLETGINFYREDFRALVQSSIENSITSGEGFDFEAVIITQKLRERWVRAIGKVEMVQGKATRIFGSFQDITDRKESELRLQAFADNLPGVAFQYFIYLDGTDALKYVTDGSQKVWGFDADSVMNDNNLVWKQIELGGELDTVKQSIMKSAETNSEWKVQWRYILPTNELRIHAGYGSPTFLPDNTIVFNSLILDITQEHRSEELLEQASEMAKIGSWELNLADQENDSMYWSPMTRKILEVDDNYNPSLTGGFEFYSGEDKVKIQKAVDQLIEKGQGFDLELLITTPEGKEKWIRCIGKDERVNETCTKIYGSYQDIHEAKSNELRLQEILDSISDAFYAVDADWNFTYFNKEAENLLKKKADEVLGRNIWEMFSPAKGTILEEIYRRVASTGQSKNFEYYYPGNGAWYDITTYPSIGGISSYFKNIDERRKAAKELEKAYKEKNEILESISDAFFAIDDEWTVTYWNKQAETVLGKAKEDIVGKNLWEEFPDALDTDFYVQYHRAMETGETVQFEEYYPTLDMWIEVTVYPSENGLSIYFKDITLRKSADIRLLKANERFELVTIATNDAIWDWDIENDDFYRSENIQNILGINASTKLKKNEFWEDAFHPEDLEKIKQSIEHVLNDPHSERWEMEYRVLNRDGEELYIIDRGIIVRNSEGKAIRMVGAMTDLSRQKKLEKELFQLNASLNNYAKELERSNEELEQFAFITSHDLQEPLRMISSFMDQLKRKYSHKLDDKALQYIYFATDGAKRMKQIIQDLLLYSRANRPLDHIEEVNLNDIIAEYTQLRRKLIAEKGAAINFDALPVIDTYRAPVTQVFHSLLDNALRYAKENESPRIQIHAKEKKAFWEFAVIDNGIGIDEKFFDKIFIIFQRLHNRNKHDGTGIGLSIAKRSVEFLGGDIWLESTAGEGSTFYFTITKNLPNI